ncbi:MAG: hypothetical protein MUF51_07735, partial [Vicinamibacteria bacterium]|nr:hypothetical protein [Vicinamibacteria bacterium]
AHIVGSWEWLRGRVLYIEFVDNKPPLLYVYYAIAQIIFGRGLAAVHLFTVLITAPLTAWAAAAFYRHERRGIVAALTFLVASAAFLAHDMQAAHAEAPMSALAAWALVALRDGDARRRPGHAALAGGLLSLAALCAYQALLWMPAVAFCILWPRAGVSLRARVTSALAFLLGAAAPVLAVYVHFVRLGASDALLYWLITVNAKYVANPITAHEAASRAISYLLPFLLVTAPLWWGLAQSLTDRDADESRMLIIGVTTAGLASSLLGLRFYPHYFIPLYLPLALAAAPAFTRWIESNARAARRLALYAAGIWALFAVLNAIAYFDDQSRVYRETDPIFRDVGARLRAERCAAGDNVFVWGWAPSIYYYADLPIAARFVSLAQARLTHYAPGNLESVRRDNGLQADDTHPHWDWLMQDLERNRATFIIDTAPAGLFRWNHYPISDYPRLAKYLDDHYTLIGELRRVRLYRRNGCGQEH